MFSSPPTFSPICRCVNLVHDLALKLSIQSVASSSTIRLQREMMNFFLFALAMALPHMLYFYIWTQSKHYTQMVNKFAPGQDPVDVMYKLACGLKIVQFTTFTIMWLSLGPIEFGNITFFRFLLFAVLFGIGQALNVGIYKAIGIPGVYYGCRLGKKVDWYDGFPFNVCPHPQYVGSIITFWGVAFLLYNADHHFPLFYAAALMTGYYTFTGYVEEKM